MDSLTRKKNTSGGSAVGGGISFQASVSAIVSVSVARGTNLAWFKGLVNDIPTEWSAETGGAGDDIQVCFKDKSIAEIQVKKGLQRGEKLWSSLIELAKAIYDEKIDYGLLIVCPNSSGTIREHLATDIERLGDGRTDGIKELAKTLQAKLEHSSLPIENICNKLRIITVHALDNDSADIKASQSELEHICKDKSQREKAWYKLYLDAEKLIRIKGRRTPSTIMNVLASSGIKLSIHTKDPISIVKKITQHTLETYTSFTIFGIDQPFNLEKSWIPLEAIIQQKTSDDTKLATVLDQYHSWEKRKFSQKKYPSETIGRFIKHCVVVAGPGMGKSTLLKKLARVYSNDGFPTLYIKLTHLSARITDGRTLEEGIFELGLANRGITYSEIQESGLKDWTILLDGLDECGTFQNTICEELIGFVKGYPDARVIITTRPIGYTSPLLKKDWRHYDLLPLETNDALVHIEQLFSDIYSRESRDFKTAYNFAEIQLKNKQNSKIVSRNPFLLGLATSLFLRKTSLGNSKTDLYENLFRLIDEDKSDRVRDNKIIQPILVAFLNIIGWDLLINPIDDLKPILERCTMELNKELQEPSLKASQISQECLNYWEQAGLLEQLHYEGTKTITFIHKTFGEYAAARYLVSLEEKEQTLLICAQLNNQASHEMISFAVSLGAVNIVFTEIIKNIKSQKDKRALLVHALKLLRKSEIPNSNILDELFDIVFEHLKTIRRRFDVDVAEAVLALCDQFSNEILSRSIEYLDHEQAWTRLSAWAFVIKIDKEKTYNLDKMIEIFRESPTIDKTQATSTKRTFGLFGGEGSKLTETIVVSAIEEIILQLPLEQADSIIKEVLSKNTNVKTNFSDSVYSVLTRYGRDELAKPFKEDFSKLIAQFHDIQSKSKNAEKIANEKIFTCLNFDNHKTVIDHHSDMLLHLSAFLSASHHDVDSVSEWDYNFDMESVTEVFKGMLGVTEIDPVLFSNDIQIALNEIKQNTFNLSGRTIDVDIKPDWEKAKNLGLNADKIETALHHRSDWVVVIAATLLENITDKGEQVSLVKRLLKTGNYRTLDVAAYFAKEVDKIDLVYKRLQQPLNSGCYYLFRILKDEALTLDSILLEIIENGVMNGDPNTAIQAAIVAKKVARPSEERLQTILLKSFDFWKQRDAPYRTTKNSKSIPTSPRKDILEALLITSTLKHNVIFEYCVDERDDICNIAKPVYLKQVSESDELKQNFLEQLISEKIGCTFLYSAFKHPIRFSSKQFKLIDQLVIHKKQCLRSAVMGILDQKDLPKEQRQIWLNQLLEDDDLDVVEKAEEYLG